MGKNLTKVNTTFQFCDGGSCKKANSDIALREARAYLRNANLWDTTHTIRTRCNGRCEDAPTLIVHPGNYWYKNLDSKKSVEIVKSHTNNNQPINDYLLFSDGWSTLKSDKEIKTTPTIFKPKQHADFGNVLSCRSSASDQYLYPLFKKLFEAPKHLKICFEENDNLVTTPHHVEYSDAFDMVVSGENINFKIAIGPITKAMEKDVPQDIINRKVGIAEVIWFQESPNYLGAIQLKNRKGKHLITIYISDKDEILWRYIFKIYLQIDPKQISKKQLL